MTNIIMMVMVMIVIRIKKIIIEVSETNFNDS